MEAPLRKDLRRRMFDEIYTYLAFWIAVSALPALAISYLVVRVSKHVWLKFLSSRYPQLEFVKTDTVRSLLDTHRNQGIINVLLCVKGELNVELIQHHLIHHVLERRDRNGEYMFPRLRNLLVSCWGNYAWDVHVPFHPENHLFVANAVHRGRTVTDANLQDYVSEIVSKYFPSDQPPWQHIIIPYASPEPKYYILVRVHHMLLTGKNSINIGDLLLVEQWKSAELMNTQEYSQKSPLVKLLPTPSAIPELWEKFNEISSNGWNEFVSEYDPVESPSALKTLPGVFHVAGLILLSAVSAFRELTKKHYNEKDSMYGQPLTAAAFLTAVQRECQRRSLTIPKAVISPLVTLDPRKWPRTAVKSTVTVTRALLKLPLSVRDEVSALKELKATGQVKRPHTLTWKYAGLAQLTARASAEAWGALVQSYRAPIKLWTDTLRSDDGQRHALQTVSLCGRKVAAWSKPVSREGVERVARALGVSCSDISLYAATEALRAYFEETDNHPPEVVLTTARAATEDFLFTFAEGDGKNYKKSQTGGMICLSLPVGATPRRIASVVGEACTRQGALAAAWAAQARYGALTRAVPSPLARLTLNVLSRRYAVSYAEINAPASPQRRKMLWGQELDSILYWRPPQANISMSLTVIQYSESVRLAVMTDSRLTPGHTVLTNRWPYAIEQLIRKVDTEIAKISAKARIPLIIEPKPQESIVHKGSSDSCGSSTSSLKPPSTEVASPPLARKRIAH